MKYRMSEGMTNIGTVLKEAMERTPRPKEPEQEPVAMKFKIYKPTVPDPMRRDINDALLPWVYDQSRDSGFVASMWVTPVSTLPPQRKKPEQWGVSAVTHPEYVAEQKRKTEELRAMVAQPEQEPVALEEKFSLLLWDYQELERAFEKITGGKWVRKSNTPQRKPLTEEQIIEATEHIDTSRHGYFVHITRAIEAAHGIKE